MYGKKKVFLQLLIENINLSLFMKQFSFPMLYNTFFSTHLTFGFCFQEEFYIVVGNILTCFFLFQEDKEHRHTFCVPFFEAFLWF